MVVVGPWQLGVCEWWFGLGTGSVMSLMWKRKDW